MNFCRKAVVGLFVLCLSLTARPSHAFSFFDNFNAENGGTGVLNYNTFANWNVSNGTVDLIGNGFFDFIPGNGLYVDLDGSTNAAGILSTKTAFAPGTYVVKFDLAGNHRNNVGETTTVSMGLGDYTENFSLAQNDPFTTITRTITLTSAGSLSFHNLGGDNIGMLLDNVSVQSVPEPIFYQMSLLLGLGGVGLLRLRRKS